MEEYLALVLVGVGALSALCAIADYDWFMDNRRARLFVAIFGRNGARAFHVLLGLA